MRCTHLAEDGFVGFTEELGEFLRVTEVQRQLADAQTPRVQLLLLAQLVNVHPLHHQRALPLLGMSHCILNVEQRAQRGAFGTYQWTAQQLRTGPRSRVLLHVFHEAVAFGVAGQLAVHQEGALDVPVGAHQLLQLLGGESVRQVGEAEQRVGGLQGDIDQASPDSAVMEGADGILSLVPVQQSHKGWRKGHYGDGDRPGRARDTHTHTHTH